MSIQGTSNPQTITVSPVFKLILLVVLSITAVAFTANVLLVLFARPEAHEEIRTLIGACSDAWKSGIAAILGLLAGKAN